MCSVHKEIILEFNKVMFSYEKDKELIRDLSFTIYDSEFIGLLGANGSGKSTILKLASGILNPQDGLIRLWGRPLQSFRPKDRAKLLSYLPQFFDINIPFRVRELVDMGFYPYEITPETTLSEALEMVGLTEKSEFYFKDLSGGEKRRAFIAMTLLQGAGLLLLDEPLANLDIKYQLDIVSLLKGLKERRNMSIIMSLHDINMALQFEKVMLIKKGNILGMGNPREILTREALTEAFDVAFEAENFYPIAQRESMNGNIIYMSSNSRL